MLNPGVSFKIVLCGDERVGKSCILERLINNQFKGGYSSYQTTLGTQTRNKLLQTNNDALQLQIWDMGGQHRFRDNNNIYFKGANSTIIFYDVTNQASYDNVQYWVDRVRQHAGNDVPIFLVGTKNDLVEKRVVAEGEAKAFAEKNKFGFLEVSANDEDQVSKLFETVSKQLLAKISHAVQMVQESKTKQQIINEIETEVKRLESPSIFSFFMNSGQTKANALKKLKELIEAKPSDLDLTQIIKDWKTEKIIDAEKEKTYAQIVHEKRINLFWQKDDMTTRTEMMLDRIANYKIG